ncbi:hypothetical protein CYMTET_26124, partial [Cymbomonas tetramitiformis]
TKLQEVCTLQLCQIWVARRGPSGAHEDTGRPNTVLSCCGLPFSTSHAHLESFHYFCATRVVKGNQGVVGQVLAAGPGRVAYCPDVRMLSVTDYPFAPAARLCHLSGVCAFGLRLPFVDGGHPSSEHEPNLVLECFLPPTPPSASLMEVIEAQVAQVRVLISVLQTAAKELNISAVVPNEGDVDRIIMIRGENTVRRGRSGNLDLTKLTASPVAHMARRLPGMDPMAPSTPPMDALMAPPMEAPMPRAAGAQGPLVTRKPGTGGERIVSLEVLQQHFVHDLRTAAKKIGVCSTTLKRICRQYNIARWPCRAIRRQRQWDQNMEEAWAGAYEGAQQPSLQIPPHSVVPHPSSAAASGGSAKPDPPHQHPQRCAATAAASAIVSSAPEPPATEASAQHGTLAPPSSISAPFPGVGHLPSSSSAEPPTLVCFDRDQASSHAPASVSCWTGSQAPPALVSAISRHEGEASSRVAPGKAVAAPHSLLKPDLPGHPPSSHLSQLASHPTNQRPVAPAMSTSASVAPVASLESAPPPTSSWYEPLGLPPPTDLAEGSPHGLGDELARSTWQLTSKIIDSGRGYMLKPGHGLPAHSEPKDPSRGGFLPSSSNQSTSSAALLQAPPCFLANDPQASSLPPSSNPHNARGGAAQSPLPAAHTARAPSGDAHTATGAVKKPSATMRPLQAELEVSLLWAPLHEPAVGPPT